MIDFLLVVPAFEESRRLPVFLEALARELEAETFLARILVVDDGSRKSECEQVAGAVETLAKAHPVILPPLLLPVNQGKGGAIMAGWASETPARWLCFADADGATPAREIARVLRSVAEDSRERDCFFASRIKLLGRAVQRKMSRHLLGRVYATLVGTLIHSGVYDSQCGFKIVSAEAYRAVRGVITEKRFAFDVELLAALVDAEMSIEEVPIDWKDIPGSKVSFLGDTVRMFVSLLRIRAKRRHWQASEGPLERLSLNVRKGRHSLAET
ncbi:MAG TPA: glycosyltransferase [Chthoniobacteraceae bacterium]|jgi:glycosyltransferase involved in cell wall biosynthesis|nr:glycosyltransferase [Chthoniobacteraceae bacterium]